MGKAEQLATPGAFTRLDTPTSLTGTLVGKLTDEIVSGRLAPGSRLPTEQQMMAFFGVSRTVVREAVSALRSDGLVLTRQGSGAFVAQDVAARPFRIDAEDLKSIKDVLHVMELRICVEIEAAGLAAERHDKRQGAAIATAFDAINAAMAAEGPTTVADFEFHRTIAAATNNPYQPRFLEFLGHYNIPRQTVRIGLEDQAARMQYVRRMQGEHARIRDAILARDAAGARAAMRRHLAGSIKRYRNMETA